MRSYSSSRRIIVRIYGALGTMEEERTERLHKFAKDSSSSDALFDFVDVHDETLVEGKISGKLIVKGVLVIQT